MNAAQVTDAFLSAIDDALRSAVMLLPKMGLFTGNPSLSNLTVLADLTALAPGFTGYALTTATMRAKRRNAAGSYIQGYLTGHFQPSAPVTGLPAIVTGYFMQATITAVDILMFAERFDTPFTFIDQFSALDVNVDGMDINATVWGGLCATC